MTDHKSDEPDHEGRKERFVDIDRMINEGLSGGRVTNQNGLITDTTTESMKKLKSTNDEFV